VLPDLILLSVLQGNAHWLLLPANPDSVKKALETTVAIAADLEGKLEE
jgi:hypothetical protein